MVIYFLFLCLHKLKKDLSINTTLENIQDKRLKLKINKIYIINILDMKISYF